MARRSTRQTSGAPTMRDVARLAGVSQSTVSRVLSETVTSPVPISEETRQRVLSVVEELGYQPNMIARSLRTQRTQMIAVMIGDISNAFYHPIVRAVQDYARTRDYDVLISNGDHLYENETRFLQTVLRRPVDGVIMAPHRLTADDLDKFMRRSHIPVVSLGAQVKHPMIDVVGGTSEPATHEAIRWLIHEQGHRRIGLIGVVDNMPPGPARLRGYERAMNAAGSGNRAGFCAEGRIHHRRRTAGDDGFLAAAKSSECRFCLQFVDGNWRDSGGAGAWLQGAGRHQRDGV